MITLLPRGVRSSAAARHQERVDVLVVCTGNVCRSPYVAGMLALARPDLRVAAAGTHAAAGQWAEPHTTAALAAAGAQVPALSRRLTRAMARDAATIVTMTRIQRAYVERICPSARGRVFTLKELARAASTADTTEWAEILVWARASAPQETRDHDDDLDDPYGGPPEGYFVMMKQADQALAAIVGARP